MSNAQGPVVPMAAPERPIDPGVTIGILFLSAGGYHHHLGFNTWKSAGGPPHPDRVTGLHHVTDVDGNDLELRWDRPFDEWPLDADGHAAGGIGEPFDLDALIADA
ncbi:MAG: hypothetical protein M3P44_16135 [Actinomycetota bacterium]|nr:hypothetical protein [Actinomycetota bacterium]